MSQPHFEVSVRMRFTLPKVKSWSPPGLLQLQSSISEVKPPRLDVFFILLERSWNVDVRNGLAWAIWTSPAQVMVERRAGSQTANLTPEHKKLGIDPIQACAGEVRHIVGKLSKRATSSLQTLLQLEVGARSYECQNSQSGVPKLSRFWTPRTLGHHNFSPQPPIETGSEPIL